MALLPMEAVHYLQEDWPEQGGQEAVEVPVGPWEIAFAEEIVSAAVAEELVWEMFSAVVEFVVVVDEGVEQQY